MICCIEQTHVFDFLNRIVILIAVIQMTFNIGDEEH